MDIFIIISVGLSVALFFALHILYLRKSNPSEVFGRLFKAYLLSNIGLGFLGIFGRWEFSALFVCLLVAWIFSTAIILLYILLIFGLMESSVRINILSEITKAGSSGIEIDKLNKKYNKDTIIKKRLDRFLKSGEVTYSLGYYQRQRKFTPYFLPDLVVILIWKMYGGLEYEK